MASIPTLGYWDIRGLAEPIRYLLKYAGVDFNDKRYVFGKGSDWDSITKEWKEEKNSLGLDFPNLPYYIDDEIKLTQSLAILRYLGRKYDLEAKDDRGYGRQVMAEQQIQDVRESVFNGLWFHDDYETRKSDHIRDKLVPQLDLLAKFMANEEWLAGSLTYVDFFAYETLDWLKLFTPETIDKYSAIKEYMTRFESLPALKEYRSSAQFKNWPLFGPIAKWGYSL